MTQHSVLTQHNRAVIIEAYILRIKIPFYSGLLLNVKKEKSYSIQTYIFGTLDRPNFQICIFITYFLVQNSLHYTCKIYALSFTQQQRLKTALLNAYFQIESYKSNLKAYINPNALL